MKYSSAVFALRKLKNKRARSGASTNFIAARMNFKQQFARPSFIVRFMGPLKLTPFASLT